MKIARAGRLLCAVILAFVAMTVGSSAKTQNAVWVDEFDGELATGWEWLAPASEAESSLTEQPGLLRITTQVRDEGLLKGAIARPVSASDFVIETQVFFTPEENFQRAGLLIYGDRENHLVLSRAYCGFVDYGCVRNGIYYDSTTSTDSYATETTSQDVAWLRLTKSGTNVRAEYSDDGTTWQFIGAHEFSYSGVPTVGLIADGNRAESPGVPAYFNFFRVEWPDDTAAAGPQTQDSQDTTPEQDADSTQPKVSDVRWVDEFDGTLDADWTWLNADDTAHSSLTERPDYLRITTQVRDEGLLKGAIARPVSASDFVIETQVFFTPEENFQRAGLLIYGDRENHLVLSRAYCGFVDYGCVRNGIYYDSTTSTDSYATETTSQDVAWLRLTKSGTNVRAEYSDDGTTWQFIGAHEFSYSGVPTVGLIADGNRAESPGVPAYFNFFRVEWPDDTAAAGPQTQDSQDTTPEQTTGLARAGITSVRWVPGDQFIEVTFDTFPVWGGWTMYVSGEPVSMEGDPGQVIVRPNGPAHSATGVLIGTDPWVTGLEDVEFPCEGTLQFDIPGAGLTNAYAFSLREDRCCTASDCERPAPEVGTEITPPVAALITISSPDQDGHATVEGVAGAVLPYASVWVENLNARNVVLADADAQGTFQAELFAPPGSSVLVKVDPTGEETRRLYNSIRSGCADSGSEINPLWGTIIPVEHSPEETAFGAPFSAVGSIRECVQWAGWWIDGTLEVYSFGLGADPAASPGDTGRIHGTLRIVSSAMDTASIGSIGTNLYFNLRRLFDADGTPAAWWMWFNSFVFTPTGLPIEVESHGGSYHIGHAEISGFRRISDRCAEADFSAEISIPNWVDPGRYEPIVYLEGGSVPLGIGEACVNTWYHWDSLSFLPKITVGEVDEPHIPWTLFGDVPVNGDRGITAREDAGDFVMPNRVVTPTHLPVIPPTDEVTGAPISYRLDLGSHWISASERRTPCPPHIPFAFPSGELTVRISKPDGTAETLGPAPIRQALSTTPTTWGGEPIDAGTGQIADLYHISTMDDRFRYSFDQWGDYSLTFTGSIDDIYGTTYPIESTFDFVVARVLDLDPAQLPTTPYVVGDSFAPGLHLFPAVPAEVEIRLTHLPDSDPDRAIVHTIKGRANLFGVFAPPSSEAFRFSQPGEYRVDYTATYHEEDGTLWTGTMTWGTVVADRNPPFEAHGRRGMDYHTNGRIDDMPAWFEVFDLPQEKVGIENYYPYFSGDVHWGNEDEAPGDSIHSLISIKDTTSDERYYDILRSAWARNVTGYRNPPDDPPTYAGLEKRIDVGEAPLFITTFDGTDPRDYPERIDLWSYWYGSSERPDVRVREIISVDNMGTAYWRFNDTYGYQIGESAEGDLPGDLKWEFGGAVFRVPDEDIAEYAVYSSLWVLLPHNDPIGARVTPPFQDATGASINGGPIMTLLGEDIDMLFLPKGLRPGDVLEVGDTISFGGHVGPPLDSRVEVTITSPSGVERSRSLRANEIGWIYDPSFDFSANEHGRWSVSVFVEHDRPYVGNGVIPQSHNTGTVLGTSGDFSFYVVPKGSAPLTITSPNPGRLPWPQGERDMGNRIRPIVIRGQVPAGTDVVHVTVHDKGVVMAQKAITPQGNGSFAYTYDAKQLQRSFPFLSLTAHEGFWEGLADEVTISFLAEGGANAQAAVITLIGEEVFLPATQAP